MSDTTVKKPKTRSMTFDSIRVHASKLTLGDKVALVKELKEQVEAEVKGRQDAAADASKLASEIAGTLTR
jgi:hypothetical protein